MVGLVHALGDKQAVIVGHDWGAPAAWTAALLRPEVFRAVVGMSVPYSPPGPVDLLTALQKMGVQNFYMQYFQQPGVAEAEAEADPQGFVHRMMYAVSGDVPPGNYFDKPLGATFLEGLPDPQPVAWLTDEDIAFYGNEFAQSGFRGALNRYRNHERDYEWLQGWAGRKIEQPCLFIGGDRDPATTLFGAVADPVAMMRMFAPRVEGHVLQGVGHWTQQEHPDEVNRLLLDWLARV